MHTHQFLVTIDSERFLQPEDLMEAFKTSKTILLDEDFVTVNVISQDYITSLTAPTNPAVPGYTIPKAG